MSDDGYDYKPLKKPSLLEGLMMILMAIISALFWRKR